MGLVSVDNRNPATRCMVRGVAREGLIRKNQNGVATRCEPGQRFKAALTPRKGRPQTVGFGMVPYLCQL